jgi:RNA polymerase sigma-70 factor (ECF subfamily)
MGDAVGVEAEAERLVRQGAFDRALTNILQTYGAELFGFLVHTLGDESAAADVFSQTAEDVWKGLPGFGFRCSVRTWLYVLGRHAVSRYRRSPWNRADRRGSEAQIEPLVELARSQTQPWLRSEIKDKFRALRAALDDDDRALLALRVDRQLEWADIARVMLGDEASDAGALGRETDRLRKRFQLLKDELRRRAREAGLLDDSR